MGDHCEVDFGDYSDDADQVELWNERQVRARKPHVCTECREPIAVGDKYRYISYKFDGAMQSEYICQSCDEAKGEFDHRMCGGFFWESMREEWSNGANVQGCINRLETAKAKALMLRQWAKWQEAEAERERRSKAIVAARKEKSDAAS